MRAPKDCSKKEIKFTNQVLHMHNIRHLREDVGSVVLVFRVTSESGLQLVKYLCKICHIPVAGRLRIRANATAIMRVTEMW